MINNYFKILLQKKSWCVCLILYVGLIPLSFNIINNYLLKMDFLIYHCVLCPWPVSSFEGSYNTTCPGRVPDVSRTCPGHVLVSVLFQNFRTSLKRTSPTKLREVSINFPTCYPILHIWGKCIAQKWPILYKFYIRTWLYKSRTCHTNIYTHLVYWVNRWTN